MVDAQAVQLKTKVYVQGRKNSLETASTIYMYEASVDRYLRALPTLTIYHSQLMVGRRDTDTWRVTDQLLVLRDERSTSF